MDAIRQVGACADEIKENVLDSGLKARDMTTCVQDVTRERMNVMKRLLEDQKSKQHFAATTEWSHRYDTRLIQKLKGEVTVLEAMLEEKKGKLQKTNEKIEELQQMANHATTQYHQTEKNIIEERRRFELFLGLRFGKVFPGEIRFFFNHIDVRDPAREFGFSIRTDGRINRIVECVPDVGEKYKPVDEKLSAGRLSIPQEHYPGPNASLVLIFLPFAEIIMKLEFPNRQPPLVCLFICATLPNKELKKIQLEGSNDIENVRLEYERDAATEILDGDDLLVARLLCTAIPSCRTLLTGFTEGDQQAYERTQIEHHLDTVAQIIREFPILRDLKKLSDSHEAFLKSLEVYLGHRTFCVGHRLSLADIAFYMYIGRLVGFNRDNVMDFYGFGVHIKRWWAYIASYVDVNSKISKLVRAAYPPLLTLAPSDRSGIKTKPSQTHTKAPQPRTYNEKLPGAVEGQVVTRFPPEPSGYLHIGHAKAALINDYFARLYKGTLILRFDDTNPAKESMEFEESIIEDLKLLNIEPTKKSHTSDHFEYLQNLCTQLIQNGHFYVDNTPVEQMRHERMQGIESACRSNTVEENLYNWDEMKQGSPTGVLCCVRSKMDMKHQNKCLRDPVMYRCITNIPHHVHGFRYKVYPTYDFACPVIDSLEGVTHAMRTNEYADRIPQYHWVLKQAELRDVQIYEFSRLNFVNTVLSKRKLQWFVDQKLVSSWADPRFPSVRGIRRRGLTVEALREFVLQQGPSKNINLMEWDKLWTQNKQILDPIVPRYMAVARDDSVVVTLLNGPKQREEKLRQLHVKNPSVGTCKQVYSNEIIIDHEDASSLHVGEEIMLMHWCNAIVDSIEHNEGLFSIRMNLHYEGNFKTAQKKIHWISSTCREPCILREFDHLITKKKLEDDDDISHFCNPHSILDTPAFVDPQVLKLTLGSCLQFERRGYFRFDAYSNESDSLPVFIKIPDGRTKPMSVIKSKVNEQSLCKGSSAGSAV